MDLISLPVISMPEYVSPTAFKIFEECNFKYYRMYLCNEPRTNFQTPAMAIGSLFDCIVKSNIAKDLNWYNKDTTLKLETLVEKSVVPIMKYLLPEAEMIFKLYKEYGAYDDLLAEQVTAVEIENFKVIKDSKFKTGIPVFGKPDFKLGNYRITDWKVNGYGSKWGQSPKPGYSRIYDSEGRKKGHKESWRTMDAVDEDWATQLTIYNWIENDDDFIDFKDIQVGIEQVVIRDNKVRVASFRNSITADFQRGLYTRLELMWTLINQQKFEKPVVRKDLCFKYNKQCEMSHKCPEFQKTFNDKEFNDLLGIKNS